MKFEKIDGKYWLKNKDGEKVAFSFPVDAREALLLKDEDGKPRYYTLEDEPRIKKVEQSQDEVVEEPKEAKIEPKSKKRKIKEEPVEVVEEKVEEEVIEETEE